MTQKLIEKYGDPFKSQVEFERKWMRLFEYPEDIRKNIPCLGKSIYCNVDFFEPYIKVLRELIKKGLHTEITSNDECFNVRLVRGSLEEYSLHAFGMAVDLNPKDNPLGLTAKQCLQRGLKPFSMAFHRVWYDNGFTVGYYFKRVDGMHYQLDSHIK